MKREVPAIRDFRVFDDGVIPMNTINRLGNSAPIQKILTQPVRKELAADAPKQLPATDKLELSGMSHLLKQLQSNDVRTDKVASIRMRIEAGTYEDDRKLDVAVDRLLDDLAK